MSMTHKEWMRRCIEECKTCGNLNTASGAERLIEKFAERMDETNGQLSEGKAYQQYVTDGEGKAVWEDRLAYKETKLAYANEQSLSSATLSKNEDGIYHLQDIDMPYQDVGNPNCVRVSCEYGVFEGKVDNFADHLPYIHGIENVTLTNVSDPSQSMNFTCYYAGYVSNGSWTFRINSASGVDFGNKETVTVDVTFTHATEETTIVPIPAEYLPNVGGKAYYLYVTANAGQAASLAYEVRNSNDFDGSGTVIAEGECTVQEFCDNLSLNQPYIPNWHIRLTGKDGAGTTYTVDTLVYNYMYADSTYCMTVLGLDSRTGIPVVVCVYDNGDHKFFRFNLSGVVA